MSSSDAFKILGIKEAGATVADVKRAYSIKLKVTRPDDDPAGFMALREAFNTARNIARHNEEYPPENQQDDFNTEDDNISDDEIVYTYDEKLDFHFNSSPLGKEIEKTVRWIRQDNVSQPEAFYDKLLVGPFFKQKQNLQYYRNFLKNFIEEEALASPDGRDWDLEVGEEQNYFRPDWLSDDLILALESRFAFLDEKPENEWDARVQNCLATLFEPVLLEQKVRIEPVQPNDLVEFHAAEIEEQNADAFGSFYDKEQKQWVDMSPVGIAMRDIDDLIKASPNNERLEEWKEILQREELQSIDEFQMMDERLRGRLMEITGFGNRSMPHTPKWLGVTVVQFLDETFGWQHQRGQNVWDHDQYAWLHRIISLKGLRSAPIRNYEAWQTADRNSFAYLGYQPMPSLLNAKNIAIFYIVWRAFDAGWRFVF